LHIGAKESINTETAMEGTDEAKPEQGGPIENDVQDGNGMADDDVQNLHFHIPDGNDEDEQEADDQHDKTDDAEDVDQNTDGENTLTGRGDLLGVETPTKRPSCSEEGPESDAFVHDGAGSEILSLPENQLGCMPETSPSKIKEVADQTDASRPSSVAKSSGTDELEELSR
jgi:hypothetical protein